MRTCLLGLLLVTQVSFWTSASEFEFVVIGDTRPRFESESFRPFESLITKIKALHPALVVNLGDLIYGYGPASKQKQWDKYEAVIKQIEVPYYQLPGNHDTHSRQARRIYGRRFGKFYQSFDYSDCHFVLLDNTEEQKWGYLGPAELAWLKADLQATSAHAVFVFMHFPVWEPDRITPEYYDFWLHTLHPLFKTSRVRAVFAGHYHAYGPTREFDGIRYFVTGGGGAELRPEYRKSGGVHHFMRVKVSGDNLDVRVITEHGELTDPEADVMGGLLFAAHNISRIGIKPDLQALRAGAPFSIFVKNPYPEPLVGQAAWLMDSSAFSVQPETVAVQIPGKTTREYKFTLRALQNTALLESLPRLEFNVVSGGARRKFHREVRFLQQASSPYRARPPGLGDDRVAWQSLPVLRLGTGAQPQAQLRSCHDAQNLYLAVTVPRVDVAEAKESGFSDEVQIGMAHALGGTEFGSDFLRLGLNSDTSEARDRSPGRRVEAAVPGIRSLCRQEQEQTTFLISTPLRLLKRLRSRRTSRLVLDLSFLAPENSPTKEPDEPAPNTFAYRVRYGSDSLVPVHFVELTLEPRR